MEPIMPKSALPPQFGDSLKGSPWAFSITADMVAKALENLAADIRSGDILMQDMKYSQHSTLDDFEKQTLVLEYMAKRAA